jgi:hypothetical protein
MKVDNFRIWIRPCLWTPPSSTARVCSRSTLRALARQGSSCCLLLTGQGRRIRPWHCCRVARMQRDFSRSMLQGPHTWPAASTQHAYRSSQMRSTVIFVIALLAATESALGFTLSTGPIAVPALDHSRRIPAQQRPLSCTGSLLVPGESAQVRDKNPLRSCGPSRIRIVSKPTTEHIRAV